MARNNDYQILENMKKGGIGSEYRNKAKSKPEDYPLVQSIRDDIKNGSMTLKTPLLIISNNHDTMPIMQMMARTYIHPLQVSTYAGGFLEFMDFLLSGGTDMASERDVQGFSYARNVFIDSPITRKGHSSNDFVGGSHGVYLFEEYTMRHHYQKYRRFHIIVPCHISELDCFSDEFKRFLTDTYKIYKYDAESGDK